MNTRRKYDRSLKERAVKLSYERSSITELATELGVFPDRIYSWRKEFADYGSASFPGHGVERLNDEGRRMRELEKKLKNTELELEILKKAIAVLYISPRSYSGHKRGKHNLREQKREALERLIQQVYAAAKGRYGAPRIAAEIQAKHQYVSVNTVSKYMKRMGLRSKLSRKYRNVNYPEYTLRTCPNYLDRQFTVDAPCKVWVSDITYIHTTHGFRYLTSVIDLYDRKVVGWSMSGTLTAADTPVRAYRMRWIRTLSRVCPAEAIVGIMPWLRASLSRSKVN